VKKAHLKTVLAFNQILHLLQTFIDNTNALSLICEDQPHEPHSHNYELIRAMCFHGIKLIQYVVLFSKIL